jgi:hypothetical protein
MKAIGKTISNMEKDWRFVQTGVDMKDSLSMENQKGLGLSYGQMEKFMKESGKTV